MKTSKWTIGQKLWGLAFCLIANLLIIGCIGVWNSNTLIGQNKIAVNQQLPAIRNMTLVDMMHDAMSAKAYLAIIVSNSKDKKEIESVRNESNEHAKDIKKFLGAIESLTLPDETKKAIESSKPKIDTYTERVKTVVDLALDGKSAQALEKLPPMQESFEELEKELEHLGELIESDAESFQKSGEVVANRISNISLGIMVFSLLFGITFSTIIIRDLRKSSKYAHFAIGNQLIRS